jgi:hypothetical protein
MERKRTTGKVLLTFGDQILIGDLISGQYRWTEGFRGKIRFDGSFIIKDVIEDKKSLLEKFILILRDLFKRD